ncbi:MAG: DUF357 domain-containing protein [Archaeoglobaceae archaeon]
MSVEEELRTETRKWLERIKRRRFDGDRRFVENIRAYINDAEYFLARGDLVRAFECVVWAWAWLEIGIEIGKVFEEKL